MFNNEFFSDPKPEDDDFHSEFYLEPLQPDINLNNLQSRNDPSSNHFNLLFENDHFSMDLTAIKSLKSQIINNDLLIENNERLKKKVQDLEMENKELKLINIKQKDQENQRFLNIENKLKAAEMINLQFKEQLSYHSKETNPHLQVFREKLKQLEKTLKFKDEETKRKDEEIGKKNIIIEELNRIITVKENELKLSREEKLEYNQSQALIPKSSPFPIKKFFIGVRKRLKKMRIHYQRITSSLNENFRKESEDMKLELGICKFDIERIKTSQEDFISEKMKSLKDDFFKDLPDKILHVFQDSKLKEQIFSSKMELETPPIEQISIKSPPEIVKTQVPEIEPKLENLNEITPLQPSKKSLVSLIKPIKKKLEIFKAQKEINEIKNKPLENYLIESDSRIKKIQKKSCNFLKEIEDFSIFQTLNPNPKSLLQICFPFYLQNNFQQAKINTPDLLKKLTPLFLLPIAQSITPLELIDILQDFSSKCEPFEVFQALQELLYDLSNVSGDIIDNKKNNSIDKINDINNINNQGDFSNFYKLFEGIRENLKNSSIVTWKWSIKTRNPRYFNEEKKSLFLEFMKKNSSQSILESFFKDSSIDRENLFQGLLSLSPLSFQLNNDLLDILTLTLLKNYLAKSQKEEVLRLLFDLMAQNFYVSRSETLINLIYSVILLSPETLIDPPGEKLKKYDLLWILQIGSSQIYGPPYGPLTLQALRLCIVDTCNHWKILNRNPQIVFLQNELKRKTLFILMRMYELLGKNQSSDVLFGLLNYDSVKDSFFEGIFDKKWALKSKKDDWPWFKGLNLDPLSLSSLLTNNLISILDKSLFFWDIGPINTIINLKEALDLNDLIATIGVYMGHKSFFMTGLLQKNLLGFVYNKKYDNTFQRTFSLLCLSMMSRGDKETLDLLIGIAQDRVINIRASQMDKLAAFFCLGKKFNVNVKEIMEQNNSSLNPIGMEFMNFLVFNKKTH